MGLAHRVSAGARLTPALTALRAAVEAPDATVDTVAAAYAAAILADRSGWASEINAAIVKRWSWRARDAIKRAAWKRIEVMP